MCIPAGRTQGPGHPPEHPSGANLSTHTWDSAFPGRIRPPTASLLQDLAPGSKSSCREPRCHPRPFAFAVNSDKLLTK